MNPAWNTWEVQGRLSNQNEKRLAACFVNHDHPHGGVLQVLHQVRGSAVYVLLSVALDVRVDLLAVPELQHGVSLRLDHGHPHVGVVLVLHQVRGSAVYVLLSVALDVCEVLPVPPQLPAK